MTRSYWRVRISSLAPLTVPVVPARSRLGVPGVGSIHLLASDPNIPGVTAREFHITGFRADPAPTAAHIAPDTGFRAGARASGRNARGDLPILDRTQGDPAGQNIPAP